MKRKTTNKNLHKASKAKKDEFYTQLVDIEKELKYYKNQFRGKIVYCNCDDPYESNFFKYFAANFNEFKLKKLITTSYNGSPIIGGQLPLFQVAGSKGKQPLKIEITKVPDMNKDGTISLEDVKYLLKQDKNIATPLKGNGDFRSDECIELLKQADIVVTNPPFSLFREYVAQLIEYKKKFLIIGNVNAITYKEIFKLIKNNDLWLGVTMDGRNIWFRVPDDYPINENVANSKIINGEKYLFVKGCIWYTNFDNIKRHEKLVLYKKYSSKEYPKYDNYNAINVDKVTEIPVDYKGAMGVPITFLNKYNPEQFEIIGQGQGNLYRELTSFGLSKKFVEDYYKSGQTGFIKENHPVLGYYDDNNKPVIPYMRIVIRNKKIKK
ncbi:MAG: adenine-specific methyltransferase EcoRI family protein [Candidatus Pacebacteria bacterium]|nr:adenine-specific methyltransferase EcoRI family protein [Candidatus Paceibacterota bacterium]MDD5721791.1 adenine-specific methyltransferase EcoRI family protein [Candidatus Paceibacterota bacterium]